MSSSPDHFLCLWSLISVELGYTACLHDAILPSRRSSLVRRLHHEPFSYHSSSRSGPVFSHIYVVHPTTPLLSLGHPLCFMPSDSLVCSLGAVTYPTLRPHFTCKCRNDLFLSRIKVLSMWSILAALCSALYCLSPARPNCSSMAASYVNETDINTGINLCNFGNAVQVHELSDGH